MSCHTKGDELACLNLRDRKDRSDRWSLILIDRLLAHFLCLTEIFNIARFSLLHLRQPRTLDEIPDLLLGQCRRVNLAPMADPHYALAAACLAEPVLTEAKERAERPPDEEDGGEDQDDEEQDDQDDEACAGVGDGGSDGVREVPLP